MNPARKTPLFSNGMKILAIDTSCDDTCCSVVEEKKGSFFIHSNVVSSQVSLHQQYGGVFPSLAKREHQKNLIPVLHQALKAAKLLARSDSKNHQPCFTKIQNIMRRDELLLTQTLDFLKQYQKPKVDLLAVTNGPGLEPCLWQGLNLIKALSLCWKLPIIPVNHIEAHLLANLLNHTTKIKLPAIGLVVSGGHTELVLIKKLGRYQIIGATKDDAAGECFDKTARVLGLNYPGGPAIAKAAAQYRKSPNSLKISLPRPMLLSQDYDFSFSGLKTAVLYHYQKQPEALRQSADYVQAMAQEIQQAVVDVLVKKTFKAADYFETPTILAGGGVASNEVLRKRLQLKAQQKNIALLLPEKIYCTDNAAMIAVAAFFHRRGARKNYTKINAQANLVL